MTSRLPLRAIHQVVHDHIHFLGERGIDGCCIDLGGAIHLCQYHDGMNDGAHAATERHERTPVHKIEIRRDTASEWRWAAIAKNGEIVADSGEGYTDREHCVEMAQRIHPGVVVMIFGGDDS